MSERERQDQCVIFTERFLVVGAQPNRRFRKPTVITTGFPKLLRIVELEFGYLDPRSRDQQLYSSLLISDEKVSSSAVLCTNQ